MPNPTDPNPRARPGPTNIRPAPWPLKNISSFPASTNALHIGPEGQLYAVNESGWVTHVYSRSKREEATGGQWITIPGWRVRGIRQGMAYWERKGWGDMSGRMAKEGGGVDEKPSGKGSVAGKPSDGGGTAEKPGAESGRGRESEKASGKEGRKRSRNRSRKRSGKGSGKEAAK